ncbi:MAG: biotin-requiring enzyme, partial [Proteobacteria bacterium]|nr:biotin-requiring enzyme [Pseudomonadota bacterium]
MVSGFFVIGIEEPENVKNELFAVGITRSNAIDYQPSIKLKATSQSEARVNVRAKTSG